MQYEIKLPQFEGPFDLLLFFIERDELDIYDIPIAKISRDFLDYINQLQILNIEIASEFILVAATLMRIKSKMLLPRKELDAEGNEVDPRQELVEKLLEYKQYKEVITDLQKMELQRNRRVGRGSAKNELSLIAEKYSAETNLQSVSLYKLLSVFENVMQRFEKDNEKIQHTVIQYSYTIKDQKKILSSLIPRGGKVAFEKLFSACENRIHAIFTFLAMLELLQEKELAIRLGEGTNNFWISRD